MKLKPAHPRKQARVEIIPLIDVVFFLLATFVLVSLSMTSQPGVRVNLPESATALPHELSETITVTVTEQGAIHWEKESLSWDLFLIRLMRYTEEKRLKNEVPRVLLNADKGAQYGQVIVVLDEIRKAGVEKLTIETRFKKRT